MAPACALDADKDLTQCRQDIWTPKDGLPPRDILAIAQTPDGYLWLGTRAGLVRFDGVAFKLYNSANTPGMSREMVLSLAVTQRGDLWIGTDGGGGGIFRNGELKPVSARRRFSKWHEILTMVETSDGSLWAGGMGTPSLRRYRHGRAEVIPDHDGIDGIAEDSKGNLWFATLYEGLLCRRLDGTIKRMDQGKVPLTVNFTCINRDIDDSLWLGSNGNGLFHYHHGIFTCYTKANGLSSNNVQCLYRDHQGNLWIGTRAGVDRWHKGRFRSFRKYDGLLNPNVTAIAEDREGNLWVGSGSVLNRFNNTKLTPFAIHTSDGPVQLSAVCRTDDGSLWFGSNLALYRLQNGHRTAFRQDANGIALGGVTVMARGPKGDLWFVAGDHLMRYTNGRFITVLTRPGIGYIGATSNGMFYWDMNAIWRYSNGQSTPIAGKVGYTFSACTDSTGTVWIAHSNGLGCLRDGRYVNYHDGLPPETHVLSVQPGRAGVLWLGTDKGLARFEDGKFTRYTCADGLPDDNLYQVLVDEHETIWVGGNRGIFAVPVAALQAHDRDPQHAIPYTLYGASDGIRSFPITMRTLKTPDGRLWFCGETGITIVDPDHIRSNNIRPSVVIEQAILNGCNLNLDHHTHVAPGKGELEIRYTGLSFVNTDQVRFRYQLEGYDREWIDAGTRRAAYYTNLPPGKYTFRVMACNNDGVWSLSRSPLTFTMRPFYYQTAWFRAACVLSGLLGVGLLWRRRVRQLQRANQELEAKIALRTAQLQQSNERLLASKEEVEAANRQLQALATTDGMTGLANHRAFQDRLRSELHRTERTGGPLTALLIDVDHFKKYNDAYGHPAGDEVLRTVARLMKECVRSQDFVARYGGEEFAILLPDTDATSALATAERIRTMVAEHPFPHRQVTLSIGIAQHQVDRTAAETLVEHADQALYAAKNSGRNRIVIAEEAQSTTRLTAVDRPALPQAA
jgi:diguanylate cyclase (GGDEF)-like protein